MRYRVALALAVAALWHEPVLAGPSELDRLLGTWGLPPADDQPGLTGSYLALFHTDDGKMRVDLSVNPQGLSCDSEREITWNVAQKRFEWPNESKTVKGDACWLTATPNGTGLDLTVWCPYECTDPEPLQIRLDRISGEHLIPPIDTASTFCSSDDVLRQELCLPGAAQEAVAKVSRAGAQVSVLSDDRSSPQPEIKIVMLDVLRACHARGGDRKCLLEALQSRVEALETAVAARQRQLAGELRASEAAAVVAENAADQKIWQGVWNLVNDEMVGTLTIRDCDDHGCTVSIAGMTNYVFGDQNRQGSCLFDDATMSYLPAGRAFAYVEPYSGDENASDAGPLANFCRLDLERIAEGFRVHLRGAGCPLRCQEAAVALSSLSGDYRPRGRPGFRCAEDTTTMNWDEENICLDPELARLDRELAAAYRNATHSVAAADRDELVRGQRAWIEHRREDCEQSAKRRTCLVEAYQTRLRELAAR